jgi:extracellular matrix regulatory protein A
MRRAGGMAMNMELVHIGFNNVIIMNRVIAIASPQSAPTKRTIQDARNKGVLIDMTNGRRTKAVVITDSGHVLLAALTPETIVGRLQASRAFDAGRANPSLGFEHNDEADL